MREKYVHSFLEGAQPLVDVHQGEMCPKQTNCLEGSQPLVDATFYLFKARSRRSKVEGFTFYLLTCLSMTLVTLAALWNRPWSGPWILLTRICGPRILLLRVSRRYRGGFQRNASAHLSLSLFGSLVVSRLDVPLVSVSRNRTSRCEQPRCSTPFGGPRKYLLCRK